MMNVLDKLQAVTQLTTTQNSAGIMKRGVARVKTCTQNHCIIFKESGERELENGQKINFNNSYQWQLFDDSILALAHLRALKPTHLVNLIRQSNNIWNSAEAHHCGDDDYSARLVLHDDIIQLDWSIVGPKKSIEITITYR